MHQAPVLPGGVGMGILGSDRRFGRHARVTDEMRAAHPGEAVAIGHFRGQTEILVEIDTATDTQHVDGWIFPGKPTTNLRLISARRDDAVIGLRLERRIAQEFQQRALQKGPVEGGIGAIQAELATPLRHRVGKNRHARGIGSALGHSHQHGDHELPQPRPQRRGLQQQTYDSAHVDAS